MATILTPEQFIQKLGTEYWGSLKIASNPSFAKGTPIAPVLPRAIRQRRIMILGAYPTARFARVGRRLVPIGNIQEPFDPATASGRALDDHYLDHLGLDRNDCWITNLVKVFLFKPEHVGAEETQNQTVMRSQFESLAGSKENLNVLAEEICISSPMLIITLGREVAGIVRGFTSNRKRNRLLDGAIVEEDFRGIPVRWVHLPHPGIVMRKGSVRNPWPDKHTEFCARLKPQIQEMIGKEAGE